MNGHLPDRHSRSGGITVQTQVSTIQSLPGQDLDAKTMPGHWLLARLGKRVLRPGGIAMTRWLIGSLEISQADDVVELAPGLGITARIIAQHSPRSFVGVERDQAAAAAVAKVIDPSRDRCVVGRAEQSGLPSESATIVVGEAMLSMQPATQKERIVNEAHRLLKPHGQYAIHEVCVQPDDLSSMERQIIEEEMSRAIRVGVKPISAAQWRQLLTTQGFEIVSEHHRPMNLLRPMRILRDEGLRGCLRILVKLASDRAARQRVWQMQRVFWRHRTHLSAIGIVARKIATERDPVI
ncbi:MAG: class I SAM-dependent methyltransferase [Pirellulales bacterium]|nr:class I SAM-dependent methyltransferase [Pirellulales bacterium]